MNTKLNFKIMKNNLIHKVFLNKTLRLDNEQCVDRH